MALLRGRSNWLGTPVPREHLPPAFPLLLHKAHVFLTREERAGTAKKAVVVSGFGECITRAWPLLQQACSLKCFLDIETVWWQVKGSNSLWRKLGAS